MSKGREIILTRTLEEGEMDAVTPFSLQELNSGEGAFHVLNDREDVQVEDASDDHSRLTAEQLESLQQEAYQEAYEKGMTEGRAAGEAKALAEGRQKFNQQAAQVAAMMKNFAEPLQSLDDEVVDELMAMVLTIAKSIIRRELESQPQQIVSLTREALAALPMNSRGVRLYLNPQDAALVRDNLILPGDESPWRIVEDPSLSRGGVKVVSENSQIDATLESRIEEVAARVMDNAAESEQ